MCKCPAVAGGGGWAQLELTDALTTIEIQSNVKREKVKMAYKKLLTILLRLSITCGI